VVGPGTCNRLSDLKKRGSGMVFVTNNAEGYSIGRLDSMGQDLASATVGQAKSTCLVCAFIGT
jgi:hypothetical protein